MKALHKIKIRELAESGRKPAQIVRELEKQGIKCPYHRAWRAVNDVTPARKAQLAQTNTPSVEGFQRESNAYLDAIYGLVSRKAFSRVQSAIEVSISEWR